MSRFTIELIDEEKAQSVREQLDQWQAKGWIRYRRADVDGGTDPAPASLHPSTEAAKRDEIMSAEEVKARLGISD